MSDYKHAFKVARMAEDALTEVKGLVGALPDLAAARAGDEAQRDAALHIEAALSSLREFISAQARQ